MYLFFSSNTRTIHFQLCTYRIAVNFGGKFSLVHGLAVSRAIIQYLNHQTTPNIRENCLVSNITKIKSAKCHALGNPPNILPILRCFGNYCIGGNNLNFHLYIVVAKTPEYINSVLYTENPWLVAVVFTYFFVVSVWLLCYVM